MAQRRKVQVLKTVGGHGHQVSVVRRRRGGTLYLRWWDPAAKGSRASGSGNWRWRSLRHNDVEQAEEAARIVSAELLAAMQAKEAGRLTVSTLFALYEQEELVHKRAPQRADDRRRLTMWQHFLGGTRNVRTIDVPTLTRFVRERRAGKVQVPGHDLRPHVSDATVAADVVLLQTVLNWATRAVREDGQPLLERNPVAGWRVPPAKGRGRPRTRKRPVATWDRWLRIYRYTDRVDPQRRFRTLWVLVGELGWRVSAICRLRRRYADLTPRPAAPWGRIYMHPDDHKESEEGWIPLSPLAARALRRHFRRHPAIGDAWLFEAPKRRGKPWSRWHARDLLERAEKLAGLEPLAGGQFHPYRRMWETARKHLPIVDVMAVQGRRDRRTLLESYQAPDAETLLAVVTGARRLRELKDAAGKGVENAAQTIASTIAGGGR